MDASPETALVVTNSNDDVSAPDALTLPPDSSVNFADDEKANAWVMENVQGLLRHVRSEYGGQHDEWANIRRMANLTRDQNAAYAGQSRAYLPVYQRALETRVSHTSRGLFPTDTYIDNSAATPSPAADLAKESVKAWMLWQLETSAKLRAEIKPFLRTLFNYGTSVAKVWWEKPPVDQRSTRMRTLPGIPELLPDYGRVHPWQSEGLRFRARNPFTWYVWPVSVNSLAEATLVFEDIQVSKQFVQEMGAKGVWKNWEKAITQNYSDTESNNQIQEGLSEAHSGAETAVDYKQGELADWRYMQECWFRMPVPRALYRPGEIPGSPVPVKAVLCGGQVIELRRNPFWHQQSPYLLMRLNEANDSFFTTGMGRSAASLQYLINDFANQTNDNGIYALNPIVKYNPNLIVGPLEPLEPGRMFGMTDPSGMEFDRPPVEQIQYGMQMVNMLISYLNDMSGAPAVLQGSGDRGGAKTATGAQLLQSNVKGDLQDIIEDIEQRILQPLMILAHSLGQQYERSDRWMAISGMEKVQFKPGMLELDFVWRWVASSQSVNQQMRAQQTAQFLQMATNPAVLQLLLQQQKMVNPEPILRRMWEDGLGQRNFGQIISPMPMMPMVPPGAAGPGQPPAEPGMSPQEPRSAVEQAPGGGVGMQPGEGEAFGEVRAGADEMAATMGGMQ
jgi:hypothetical protein